MQRTTFIERDWKKTIKAGAICAACLAAAVWFCLLDAAFLAFALVPLLFAAWFGYRAYAKCAIAHCPGCGHELEDLSTGDNRAVLCPLCFKYVESAAGELRLTPETFVAEHPIFRTALPSRFTWPDGCVVCGGEVARVETVSRQTKADAPVAKDLAVRAASLGFAKLVTNVTTSIDVPHCANHQHGVSILSPGFDADEAEHFLAFRSYAMQRQFCALNKVRPR
jgi:hypothetical protein